MARLSEFSGDMEDGFRELVDLYLTQTIQQLEQLRVAVDNGNGERVNRLAHSCAGASATCGMRFLVPLLRQLERESAAGDLANSKTLCERSLVEFARIRQFLEDSMAGLAAEPLKH